MYRKQPSGWDVIIVGGGLVGCASAWYAARAGMRVLVIEQDHVGAAQSGRNLGFVRQQQRDFRELSLMIAARGLWENMEETLGQDVGWVQGGNLSLAFSDADMAAREEWRQQAVDAFGLDTRLLTAAQARELVPELCGTVVGALYTPSDGRAEPTRVTRAFHHAAVAAGAQMLLGHRVDGLSLAGGRVAGVVAGGRLLRADIVVCAAGSGSSRLLRGAGVFLPQDKIRATVVRTAPVNADIRPCVSGPLTGIRQTVDGSLHLSVAGGEYDVRLDSLRYARWFARARKDHAEGISVNYLPFLSGLRRPAQLPIADIPPSRENPLPQAERVEQALDECATLFPALGRLQVAASWAGYIDTLPDVIPAIGPVAAVGGLLVATGFSGHGFGPAPMAGKVIAELMAGETPSADISRLSPDRFLTMKPE